MVIPSLNLSGHRLSRQGRLALATYLGIFALDFHGERGGSLIHYLLLGGCLIAFGAIMAMAHPHLKRSQGASRELGIIVGIWFSYLGTTFATFLVYSTMGWTDTTLTRYGRLVLPYLLFGLSLIVVRTLQKLGAHPRELTRILLPMTLFACVWKSIISTWLLNRELAQMRYQMISPGITYLIAVGAIALLLSTEINWLALFSFVVALSVVLLSATRAFLINVFACFVACACLAVKCRDSAFSFTRIRVGGLVILLGGFVAVCLVQPGIVETWTDRLVNNLGKYTERDATLTAREAEALGMWEAISEDPVYFLFGKGMGTSYSWHASYRTLLRGVEEEEYQVDIWSHSHSWWTYQLFCSGLVFGPVFFLLIFYSLYRSFLVASRFPQYRHQKDRNVLLIGFVGLMSYFAQSFTTNPMVERLGGLVLGILVGMTFWLASDGEPPG